MVCVIELIICFLSTGRSQCIVSFIAHSAFSTSHIYAITFVPLLEYLPLAKMEMRTLVAAMLQFFNHFVSLRYTADGLQSIEQNFDIL